MAVKIFIDEEYGWRYWRWEHPGTVEELREDWKAGRIPPRIGYVKAAPGHKGFVVPVDPAGEYWRTVVEPATDGMSEEESAAYLDANEERITAAMEEEWRKFLAGYDAEAHIHEEDDTGLRIFADKSGLPWPFQSPYGDGDREDNPLPKEVVEGDWETWAAMLELEEAGCPAAMNRVVVDAVAKAAEDLGMPIPVTDIVVAMRDAGRIGDLWAGVSAASIMKVLADAGAFAKWGVAGFREPTP